MSKRRGSFAYSSGTKRVQASDCIFLPCRFDSRLIVSDLVGFTPATTLSSYKVNFTRSSISRYESFRCPHQQTELSRAIHRLDEKEERIEIVIVARPELAASGTSCSLRPEGSIVASLTIS